MQARIAELIKNPSLRTKIGENAWKTIKKNHTWKSKGEQLSQLCRAVVDKSKK